MGYFYSISELPSTEPTPGIRRKVVNGTGLQVVISDVDESFVADGELHSHSSEQIGIVVEGRYEIAVGSDSRLLVPGDLFVIPPNVEHGPLRMLGRSRTIDLFHPPRL